jgi:hypothetical protein
MCARISLDIDARRHLAQFHARLGAAETQRSVT